MRTDAVNGLIETGDMKMSYVSFGHGPGHLILLPGLSDGLATVKGKARLLSQPYKLFFEKYTVYMFSRREDMPKGFSIRDMAEDQAEAIKQLGITEASVLGVSQGGMIAQVLAAEHPDLVNQLVLAVTAPCVNEMIRENVERWSSYAKAGNHKALITDTAEKSYSANYLKKFRKLYPVIGLIGKPQSYDRFLVNAEAILAFDAVDKLAQIECPVLIIGGAMDQTVGVQASYDMHERIRNSELYIYEEYGHAAYEEAKDFNQRIFAWLEQTGEPDRRKE